MSFVEEFGKIVIILRAPPGAGKTTFASFLREMIKHTQITTTYVSMDAIRESEGRKFSYTNLQEDVRKMDRMFDAAVEGGINIIILDNTHSREWEYARKKDKAERYGYTVFLIEVQSDFWTCLRRQKHGVPFYKMQEMFDRWESPIRRGKDRIKDMEAELNNIIEAFKPSTKSMESD